MAFLYPNKKTDEMFDFEIMEDFLFTQNKIEADLRAILANLEDEEYGRKAKDGSKNLKYYTTELNRNLVTKAFVDACLKHRIHPNLDKSLVNLDSDMAMAWIKYEHFLYPPYTDLVIKSDLKLSEHESRRLREKYNEYNRCVMPYFEFFKKPNEEKAKILFGSLKKKLADRVQLNEKEYSKLKLKDIAAFTQAAYGAMGEPGVMNIVTRYMDVYGVDINTYEKMGNKFGLATIFNTRETPSMKLMHDAEMDTKEWYQYYTGFGNVLYVSHKYLPKVKEYILEQLGEKWGCVDLYKNQFKAIEYAILHTD